MEFVSSIMRPIGTIITTSVTPCGTRLVHTIRLHNGAVMRHVGSVRPHFGAAARHIGMVGAHRAPVGRKARIDTLGINEPVISSVSIVTTVAECQRTRNWASPPFIAMPATIQPEYAMAMFRAPAVRAVIPRAIEVDRIIVHRPFVGRISRSGSIKDAGYTDADRHIDACRRGCRNHDSRAGKSAAANVDLKINSFVDFLVFVGSLDSGMLPDAPEDM